MEKNWIFWHSNLVRQSHWTNDAIAAAAQGRKRWRWRPDKGFLKEHTLLSIESLFNQCVTILENSPSNLTSTTSLFWALSPFWTPTGRRRRRRRTPREERRRRRRRWRRQRRRRRTKTSPTESVLKVGRGWKTSIGSFWTSKCGHIGSWRATERSSCCTTAKTATRRSTASRCGERRGPGMYIRIMDNK